MASFTVKSGAVCKFSIRSSKAGTVNKRKAGNKN